MTSENQVDLAFAVLGQPIVVRAPAQPDAWHARLRALLAPFAVAAAPAEAEVIGVDYTEADGLWHITYDKFSNMIGDESRLIQHIEWQVFTCAVQNAPGALALHGGAVTRAGRALLLPGVSGTGKTTLSLALTTQGWHYLTDDIALLDETPAGVAVQPCARCCHVSAASLAQLTERGTALEGPIADLPEHFHAAAPGQAAPVGWIVAPQFTPDGELSLTPLTQAETVALLITSAFRQNTRTLRQQWASAIALARQAPGWRLTFPTLAAGLAALDQVTTKEPVP